MVSLLLSCPETTLLTFVFEKLLVYQKAISFADVICTWTRDLPTRLFFLLNQLTRAALSIAANVARLARVCFAALNGCPPC